MNCRNCQHPLTHVFVDLVNSPPSNSFLTAEQLCQPEIFYPLRVFVCDRCFLVQIDEFKKATEIFAADYAYFSSFSSTWLTHCANYVAMMCERFGYGETSQVIEIASNDGYLLQYFHQRRVPVLGIEPSLNTAQAARAKGIETLTEFFGTALAERLAASGRQADLLLGNNVLAHVPDLNDFVNGLRIALKPRGTVTMEFPHLLRLIENNQFDTIYHEHFSYLSFHTVHSIFAKHALEIFDVEELSTHGGSLRIFAEHTADASNTKSSRVSDLLGRERDSGMLTLPHYLEFQPKANRVKNDLLGFLLQQKNLHKNVAAYGAAAKGNTLLNYCGIKKDLVPYVVDASPHKQGKFLPASHIPVVHESVLRQTKPDFVLILPWNIRPEITQQLNYIKEWGGLFVTAIPTLEIFDGQ